MIPVHGNEDWYRGRSEPERAWAGRLRLMPASVGPNGRSGLSFALETDQGQLPVYAAGAEQLLSPFAQRAVVIRGKLIDLSEEGLGLELWVGSIAGA